MVTFGRLLTGYFKVCCLLVSSWQIFTLSASYIARAKKVQKELILAQKTDLLDKDHARNMN